MNLIFIKVWYVCIILYIQHMLIVLFSQKFSFFVCDNSDSKHRHYLLCLLLLLFSALHLTDIHMDEHTHTHARTHACTYTHTHTYIYMHARTHTHLRLLEQQQPSNSWPTNMLLQPGNLIDYLTDWLCGWITDCQWKLCLIFFWLLSVWGLLQERQARAMASIVNLEIPGELAFVYSKLDGQWPLVLFLLTWHLCRQSSVWHSGSSLDLTSL